MAQHTMSIGLRTSLGARNKRSERLTDCLEATAMLALSSDSAPDNRGFVSEDGTDGAEQGDSTQDKVAKTGLAMADLQLTTD